MQWDIERKTQHNWNFQSTQSRLGAVKCKRSETGKQRSLCFTPRAGGQVPFEGIFSGWGQAGSTWGTRTSWAVVSEAWQGVNKLGRDGRAATGAAIIPLNEATLQQTAPLLNGALDLRLEMRQWWWGEDFTVEIENTNLEPVGGILLNESCLSLPWWLGEGGRTRTQHKFKCPRFPHFWPSQHWGPPGWNCLVCTLENKLNTSAECITGSETSSLCYFWSLATENVLPRVCFLRCALWVCGGKRRARGLPRGSLGFHCPTAALWEERQVSVGKPNDFFVCVMLQNSPNSPK